MADHTQQQILDAVKAVLTAARTAAQSRVDLDRTDELQESDLPAISILPLDDTGDESVEQLTVSWPQVLLRTYTFSINSVCGGERGSMRAARNLAGAVETALLASIDAVQAAGVTIEMALVDSSEVKTGDANTRLFSVRQQWRAQYQTQGGAPGVPL